MILINPLFNADSKLLALHAVKLKVTACTTWMVNGYHCIIQVVRWYCVPEYSI